LNPNPTKAWITADLLSFIFIGLLCIPLIISPSTDYRRTAYR
jgi:hypothetical protein